MTTLFTPLKIGNIELSHRIIMAPLTRYRADENAVPHDIAAEYYEQRASPDGLLITEGTFISEEAGGYKNVPGIWNDAQIAGWIVIADRVHAKGGRIFMQIWALGRAANPKFLASKGHKLVGASELPIKHGGPAPTPLTKEDIQRYVRTYAGAAQNAVYGAGLDGVEIHDANGYLLDQFVQDVTNKRTDKYGGSIENRSRFTLEVIEAIAKAIGQEKIGIRFSPFGTFQGMRMADPVPTFSYLAKTIRAKYPNFGYLHIIGPRTTGDVDADPGSDNIDFLRDIWGPDSFLLAGGLEPDTAEQMVSRYGGGAVFGRYFISNPDLPLRIRKKLPLAKWDRSTFYTPGPEARKGYVDYPFAEETQDPVSKL